MKLRDLVAKVIADSLMMMADRLDKRLDDRLDKLAIPNVRGVWEADGAYRTNDIVTRDYALWIATKDSKGEKPGAATPPEATSWPAWRLLVRSGPRSATFTLDPKSCVLSIKVGDEQPAELGSIKPALYDALVKCGVLNAEQVKQLEAQS